MRVLVVCHGNINRSPVAAAIIRRETGWDTLGGAQWETRSVGLGDYPSRRATRRAREFAESRGINLSDHRSAVIAEEDAQWADLILYMDGGNRRRLLRMGADEGKMRCLASFAGETRIPDPQFDKRRAVEYFELLERSSLCFVAAMGHDSQS